MASSDPSAERAARDALLACAELLAQDRARRWQLVVGFLAVTAATLAAGLVHASFRLNDARARAAAAEARCAPPQGAP